MNRYTAQILVSLVILIAPVLAINATVSQTPSSYANDTSYRATIFLLSSSFSNSTSYNATAKQSIASFGNTTERVVRLSAALKFFDMQQSGNQTLSVIVTDDQDSLQASAVVNGTITAPDGVRTQINFTEGAAGNYTNSFLFDQVGNWTIAVSVSKAGFSNVTSTKSIYIGLIELVSFTGIDVFQSTTAFFDLGLRNKGTAASTVVPFLLIRDSSGGIVFSVQGLSSTVTAGQNISLFQHNTLTWSVGSTAAGTYNATAYLRFTDTTNTTVQTTNRTFLFQVKAVPTTTTTTTTTGGGTTIISGGGAVYTIIQNVSQAAENVPTADFIQFVTVPILVEAYQGRTVQQTVHIFNPLDTPIENIGMTIKGLPEGWFILLDNGVVSLGPQEDAIINVLFVIPDYAQPATYQASFSFSNANYIRDFTFILRVNQLIPGQTATVSKRVAVEELSDHTNFVISVRNRDKFLESLTITEKIDKSIASHVSALEFSIPPTKIIQPDPIVQWTFKNLLPNEQRNITYRVKKTINTTKPFIQTSIEELISVERVSEALPAVVFIDIYDATVIVPIAILLLLAIIHKMRKSRSRESLREARRLAERLRG